MAYIGVIVHMRIACWVLGIYCLLAATPPVSYEHIFGEDYAGAVYFIRQNKPLIDNVLAGDRPVVESALFPELIRYSRFRDLMETSALEVLYARYGRDYADFSIGRFQMKPSFAEDVEQYLMQFPAIAPELARQLPCTATEQGRRQRVARLQQPLWQLRYARAFYAVVCHRFPGLPQDGDARVRFVAAAYNSGFLRPEAEINRWAVTRSFPYGPHYSGVQYAYSDIAAVYYQHQFSNQAP